MNYNAIDTNDVKETLAKNNAKAINGYNPFEEVELQNKSNCRAPAYKWAGFIVPKMKCTNFENKHFKYRPNGVTPEEYWNWLHALLSKTYDERVAIEKRMQKVIEDGGNFQAMLVEAIKKFNRENFI